MNLHFTEQGVKGLVVCTISCAEEKDKKDLQSALHALRCIIGPRAKLVCTSTIEPTLKQGVVLVTILFTRYDAFSYHNYVYFLSREFDCIIASIR